MKKVFGFTLFIAVCMLLLPLIGLNSEKDNISASAIITDEPSKDSPLKIDTEAEKFRLLLGDEIIELTREEYITGVVAAEMPALYHEEALKAQAVASYTFAITRKAENKDKDYDITADHTVDQSFVTTEQLKERWGENYEEYANKIKKAVQETDKLIITHGGKPITAVYHAISSGKTENCKNVWGSERAYLVPVTSEGDKLASNYITEISFTSEEIKEKLKTEFSGEEKSYFSKIKKTDSGTVKEVTVCSAKFTGFELQKALDLRSACFDIEYSDSVFKFIVYGAGHGVGMSQNGANFMAKQGSDFKEILTHYYKGCKIE